MAGVRDNLVGDENPKEVLNGPWSVSNAVSLFYKQYGVIFL